MRLIGKIPFLIYTLILVAGGIVAYFFWGERMPFVQVDLFKVSLQIDSAINDLLVEWGIDDTDIINEYRKEVRDGDQVWVVVNRDIGISRERVPGEYPDLLEQAIRTTGAEVYRKETRGNRFIFESGSQKHMLNRLIFTFLREKSSRTSYAAIVIDDVGYNKKIIEAFLNLGIPLTFAIIPQEQFSEELAEIIHRSGNEIIIHMPMEPKDYPKANPGSHALFCRMTDEEVREKFFENIYSLPFSVGINNHMGSRFMEDRDKVEILMSCVSQSGLFFLDSRTTSHSLFPEIAREMGIPRLLNDVFLDSEDDIRHIEQQLRLLINRAKQMHTAVGIGHVHKKHTALAIKKTLRFFKYHGIELVTLSELLDLSKKS